MTGNCKGKRSDNKVLKGCKTENDRCVTELISSDSDLHKCRTSESTRKYHTVRSKVLKHVQRFQKYLASNSQVSDPPQMSAICAVVAQLIYLSNSCSVYVMTTSRAVLLGAKECDGHQKEKTTASTLLRKVVFKYSECSRGFSFQLINH